MAMEATALAINAALEQAEKRTRRERIATAAMQGMLAYHSTGAVEFKAEHALAAVQLADALIAELDKKP